MNNKRNILIIGPPDSGKETVMQDLESLINRGYLMIKAYTYGRVTINNTKNYLFSSTKGEFRSLEEILCKWENKKDTDGIIILLDSSRGVKETDIEIIELVTKTNIPHIIFSNKQDLNCNGLKNDFTDAIIIPTIATEGIGVKDGLKILLKQIEQEKNHLEVGRSEEIKRSEESYKKVYSSKRLGNGAINPKKKSLNVVKPKNSSICRLRIIMHPIELDSVKKTLEKCGFSNITVTEVRCATTEACSTETYRADHHSIDLKPKFELAMVVKREDLKYVVRAIKTVKTEDIDDSIFISPVERVLRVRTREEGEEAID